MSELPYLVFTGSTSQNLAKKICDSLGCPLGKARTEHSANGEFTVFCEESIRGGDILLVQSTYPDADNIMELLPMIDATERASAYYTTVVIPYLGWARQGRKDKPRVSIGAKFIAGLLSIADVTRLVTMDLHADQIQGFFNVPADHLYGSTVFTEHIEHSVPVENLCIVTSDVGSTERANSYARHFGISMVICHKRRAKANEVVKMVIVGDVAGKDIILVDDIADTADTMTKAANLILGHDARSVRAFTTHTVMNDPATRCIDQSGLTEMVFTDLIPYPKKSEKVCIISVVELSAELICQVCSYESISSLYTFQTHSVYNGIP